MLPEESRPHAAGSDDPDTRGRAPVTLRALRVLVVGHGPPTTGGIPTFVTRLVADEWMLEHVERLDYLNTCPPGTKRPGAASLANVRWTLAHALAVWRSARRVDVVHLNLAATPTLPLLRALVLCGAARTAGAAVVLHAHTGELHNCLRDRVYRTLFGVLVRIVDAVVVVSRAQEESARPLGGHKIVRIENGLPVQEFATGPKSDPPVVAFVGTVCVRKGLLDLRDALVRLRTASRTAAPPSVVIVGDGEQEGPGSYELIRDAFFSSGLSNTRFVGAVPREEVALVLAGAAVFCLPSHTEGFPLSLLEGMASSAAPIATSVGDIPFMLDEGGCGVLVRPHDTVGLAAGLERILSDPDERERLGRAARKRAESHFDFETMVRRLHALYSELAGASPGIDPAE